LPNSKALSSLIVVCDLPNLSTAWLEYLVGRAPGSQAGAALAVNRHRGCSRFRDVT
jgi:hypothetical protein